LVSKNKIEPIIKLLIKKMERATGRNNKGVGVGGPP
jgi:hypothetical protein